MSQFINFGDGSDGAATLSGTDAPIDSSCSGTSGTTSLSATNVSFVAGQQILIHQSRGTGAGAWEVNIIDSYVAGTITTVFALANTYTDSGASQAQVLVMKQYSQVTISGTLTAQAWGGNIGGIIAFLCTGETNISGSLTCSGKGFVGGVGVNGGIGKTGESESGAGQVVQQGSNGPGGGGGGNTGTGGGGGGGGSASGGSAGLGDGGTGGTTSSSVGDLTTMVFGGAGGSGGGAAGTISGDGGVGGGLLFLFTSKLTLTGTINLDGQVGQVPNNNNAFSGGGGGGGGGCGIIKTADGTFGTTLLTGLGGAGGAGNALSSGANGGAGSVGRVRIEACSRTGTTNPAASESIGGQSYCASPGMIF